MNNRSKLQISGIGLLHKIWIHVLTRKTTKLLLENVSVAFNEEIKVHQYSSLWYGGEVAVISYRHCKFLLSAIGDVYADFMDKADGGRSLFYVKDKNNRGLLADELISYIKTDKELYAVMRGTHKRYMLDLTYNNWWECFLVDAEGGFHDLMMALESDGVFDAIAEIIAEMDEIVEHNKNGKGGAV